MIPFDAALAALKKCDCPEDKIIQSSCYWIPLQWVYVRMVENKDLVRLSDLSYEKRLSYWEVVKNLDKPKWVKISIAQSIYVYQFITNNL